MPTVGFIGAGNIAHAIVRGYFPVADRHTRLIAFDRNAHKVAALSSFGVVAKASAAEVVAESDYLLLAIKPQNIAQLLSDLRGKISSHTVVISIVAGIDEKYLKSAIGIDAKIVLAMPNTPLLVGMGATALARILPTTADEFSFVCDLFGAAGCVVEVPPDKLNAVIGISGSAPAFVYEITKYFIDFATQQGIDELSAQKLFYQTMVGSVEMMRQSGQTIDELIAMVSSKGGTTTAGLNAMRAAGLQDALKQGFEASVHRAKEMGKEFTN